MEYFYKVKLMNYIKEHILVYHNCFYTNYFIVCKTIDNIVINTMFNKQGNYVTKLEKERLCLMNSINSIEIKDHRDLILPDENDPYPSSRRYYHKCLYEYNILYKNITVSLKVIEDRQFLSMFNKNGNFIKYNKKTSGLFLSLKQKTKIIKKLKTASLLLVFYFKSMKKRYEPGGNGYKIALGNFQNLVNA